MRKNIFRILILLDLLKTQKIEIIILGLMIIFLLPHKFKTYITNTETETRINKKLPIIVKENLLIKLNYFHVIKRNLQLKSSNLKLI